MKRYRAVCDSKRIRRQLICQISLAPGFSHVSESLIPRPLLSYLDSLITALKCGANEISNRLNRKEKGEAMKNFAILLCFLITTGAMEVRAQSGVDRDLLAEIYKIKAIDNHAHPLRYDAPGEKPDDEFDALPLDAIVPFPLPVRLSPSNAEFIRAWHDLYRYGHNDMSEAHVRELMAAKQRVLNERGDSFPAWILDQLNIETMFANRVAMGRGLAAPRFRWVA